MYTVSRRLLKYKKNAHKFCAPQCRKLNLSSIPFVEHKLFQYLSYLI